MKNRLRNYNRLLLIAVFILLPGLLYLLGDFPRRTWLKELFSILTIWGFFMMLMQFFLSRGNQKSIRQGHKMSQVIKWHKVLGYVFVSILLLHPFMIVFPRYYESGVTPQDALNTILATTDSNALVLGMVAWCLMLIIGITSIFRNKLGLSYKTWRVIHGVFSIIFIILATIHATNLGRHMSTAMISLIYALATTGVLLILKIYILKPKAPKL